MPPAVSRADLQCVVALTRLPIVCPQFQLATGKAEILSHALQHWPDVALIYAGLLFFFFWLLVVPVTLATVYDAFVMTEERIKTTLERDAEIRAKERAHQQAHSKHR
jgi:hypothetical protein